MPRSARAIVAGGCYHLINRGNQQATVFATPADYAGFVDLILEAQSRDPIDLFAACLMPNHFHLVARARVAASVSRWMHWLLTTHTRRSHARSETSGRLWQGRFKAFPIQQDEHLLAVMRYVERNALRAGLVPRSRDWPWGSLAWPFGAHDRGLLVPPPVALPANWESYVDSPQTPDELAAIRLSVNRQRPYGDASWVDEVAPSLGLQFTTRARGRPRKEAADADDRSAQDGQCPLAFGAARD